MKATIITSAAVFLTVAAASPTTRSDVPSTTAEAEVPAHSVVVPVLAPSGDLLGVASGKAAVPSLEAAAVQVKLKKNHKNSKFVKIMNSIFRPNRVPESEKGKRDLPSEHEHEREARGIPAALHNWDPYALPRVPKQTLTTPAPTPLPTIILPRGEEGKGYHGHGADDVKDSADKVISVVIGADTILIPQEGTTTVEHHRQKLARPTNIREGHHQDQENSGELIATVIQDGVSTVLPIGLQPTIVPLGKRCDSQHSAELMGTTVTTSTSTVFVTSTKVDVTSTIPTTLAPSPTVVPKEGEDEEEGGDEEEGDDKGDDGKEDDGKEDDGKEDDDKVEDKDDEEDDDEDEEEGLEHNEIVVYYGEDTIYVPLDGPVSISYGPEHLWTDLHSEAPHTVIQTATVVQNGWSVTLPVSDLSRALPIGKTIPAQFLHPTTTTTDEGGPPLVTGYPYEWHSLHNRLAVTTSSDIPTPKATVKSLPRTFMTAARPTPHKLHGEHDHNDLTV